MTSISEQIRSRQDFSYNTKVFIKNILGELLFISLNGVKKIKIKFKMLGIEIVRFVNISEKKKNLAGKQEQIDVFMFI